MIIKDWNQRFNRSLHNSSTFTTRRFDRNITFLFRTENNVSSLYIEALNTLTYMHINTRIQCILNLSYSLVLPNRFTINWWPSVMLVSIISWFSFQCWPEKVLFYIWVIILSKVPFFHIYQKPVDFKVIIFPDEKLSTFIYS